MRENHACFTCLKKAGRDHRASKYSRRKQCAQKTDGNHCKYHHHVLLHSANPAASVSVASVGNDTKAMLPVITIEMLGKDNQHKKGNVLLESGSQINLICMSTAKSFGLTGKGVLISIKKVGGEEEVLASVSIAYHVRRIRR